MLSMATIYCTFLSIQIFIEMLYIDHIKNIIICKMLMHLKVSEYCST